MKSIRNWSIRTRLLAAFLGVLIPYLALASVGAVGFNLLWRSIQKMQHEVVQEMRGAADLQLALVNLLMPANDYLIMGDVTEREEFERRLARVREMLARVERMHLQHPEELRALSEVRSRLPEIEALSREILALTDPRGSREAPGKMKAMDALGEEAAAWLGRFRKANEREIAEEVKRSVGVMWRAAATVLAALILSAAGGVGLALLFTRWIGAPLKAIAEGSRRMAEGDLSARVNESGGAELGATAWAFNLMAERLEASYAALRRTNEELAAVNSIAVALTSTLELKQVFKVLTQRTAQAVGADRCSVNLWRGGHVVPVMSQFADGHADPALWVKFKAMGPYRLEEVPVHAQAIRTKRPVAIEDATTSSLYPAAWVETFGIRAALVVPLVRQDEVIGTLNLDQTRGPCRWSQDQIDLAMTIASQAALAIENVRLYEESEQRRRSAEALAALGRELTQSLDFAAVAEQTSDNIRRLLGVFQSALYRLEPESGDLVVVAVSGNLSPSFVPHLTFPRGSGVVGLAVRDRVPVASENVLTDPRITFSPELRSVVEQAEFRSVLAVPLIAKGQVVGAISVRDKAERVFTEDEIRMAQAFADQAALAMENARLYQELAVRIKELEGARASVKRLQGLLPICAWCKKVRGDQNYWQSVEGYVAEHADVRFSHGICPECREKLVARREANG